jgi:drug/metabolite transporter (DMT)-like permease
MWYRMMLIACVTNGFGAFGARVLQALGLAGTHAFLYLAFWYSAGFALALVAFLAGQRELLGREIAIGGLMGLCSSLGWVCLTTAIAKGVPGYLVFPIAIGGSLSIVAAVGVLVFKERISPYGYLGILAGIAGIVLLASV